MYVTQSKSACRLKAQLRLFLLCQCLLLLFSPSNDTADYQKKSQLQQLYLFLNEPITAEKAVWEENYKQIRARERTFLHSRSFLRRTISQNHDHAPQRQTFRNSAGKFGHKQKSRKQKRAFPLKTLYSQHTANICAQLLQLPNIQFILFFSLYFHIF